MQSGSKLCCTARRSLQKLVERFACAQMDLNKLYKVYSSRAMTPALLHNTSNVGLQENAVVDAKLQYVTAASARSEVPWQVGSELIIEDPKLITGSV